MPTTTPTKTPLPYDIQVKVADSMRTYTENLFGAVDAIQDWIKEGTFDAGFGHAVARRVTRLTEIHDPRCSTPRGLFQPRWTRFARAYALVFRVRPDLADRELDPGFITQVLNGDAAGAVATRLRLVLDWWFNLHAEDLFYRFHRLVYHYAVVVVEREEGKSGR